MILLDTSGLLAAVDSAQRHHEEAAAALGSAKAPLLLSPFVLAELDYLLTARVGEAARMALLSEVARGAYALEPFSVADVSRAREVVETYEGLGISLADASIVVLGERHGATEVLSLDERHFRVLTNGPVPFRLLPADA